MARPSLSSLASLTWLAWLAVPLAMMVPVACTSASPKPSTADRGAIMLALSTDLVVGKDIDLLQVSVSHHGSVQLDQSFPLDVDPMHAKDLPQTLAVSSQVGDVDPVTIVVTASRKGVARIQRRAVVTVPDQRTALLRMPMQWLCDGSAPGAVVPAGAGLPCAEGQTCIAGSCAPAEVDVATLPDFVKSNVFGAACYDVAGCFPSQPGAAPSKAPFSGCLLPAANGPAGTQGGLFLELPRGSDGICDDSRCLIALEEDRTFGFSVSGSTVQDGAQKVAALALPPAVCKRLDAAATGTLALWSSTGCPSKTASTSDCPPKVFVATDEVAALTSAPRCLAVDDKNVYFATADALSAVPKSGGVAKPLVTGRTAIGQCASDGVNVYFSDGSSLFAVPTSGGSATMLGALGGAKVRLALSNDSVVATVEDASPSVLRAFAKADGKSTVLYSVAAGGDGGVASGTLQGVTVDKETSSVFFAYVATGGFDLLRVPLAGGAATPVGAFKPGPAAVVPVTSLAVDSKFLYGGGRFTMGPTVSSIIGRIRKDGSEAMPTTFVQGLPDTPAGYDRGMVAVDGALLFNAGMTIERYDPAAGMQSTIASTASPVALFTVDASNVYLATVNPPRVARAKR
jgi:hypothetical protein